MNIQLIVVREGKWTVYTGTEKVNRLIKKFCMTNLNNIYYNVFCFLNIDSKGSDIAPFG